MMRACVEASGLGSFDWSAASTLIAGGIAGAFVLLGLMANSARARLDTRRAVYAEAVRAVSDYLEGPYRVARCHDDADQRFELSRDLSEIQGRLDAHLVLVELHAPGPVFDAYKEYISVARIEAGGQMAEQWLKRAPRRRRGMDINERFDRSASTAAKKVLLERMVADILPRRSFRKRLF